MEGVLLESGRKAEESRVCDNHGKHDCYRNESANNAESFLKLFIKHNPQHSTTLL